MPRANRYYTAGRYYHVTHRCHDRSFLLKFDKDKNLYRAMLRERLPKHGVSLIGYCLTSNHVHLLLRPNQQDDIAGLMHSLAGDFARDYNRRRKRSNAFWGERYHATLVESGVSVWRCLRYIDMNMVRAGVVTHPGDWEWCGIQEVAGRRTRYCLVDKEHLFQAVEAKDADEFRASYASYVDEAVRGGKLERQSAWTESFAVGSEPFIRSVAPTIKNRSYLEAMDSGDSEIGWVLRERGTDFS